MRADRVELALLRPDITRAEIERACASAAQARIAAVCVHPSWTKLCYELLLKTGVTLCVAVGYPAGATTTLAKIFEADQAIEAGAREIVMAMHLGALRSALHDFVRSDVAGVAQTCRRVKQPGAQLTVGVEVALLEPADCSQAYRLAREAGADAVQVGTGAAANATTADVRLARAVVGLERAVKAYAGACAPAEVEALLNAGASRVVVEPTALARLMVFDDQDR